MTALLGAGAAPDFIVLPKTDGPDQLRIVDRLLARTCPETRLVGLMHSPFFDVSDGHGLADEVRQAVAMGFRAKAAIHPGQVAAINDALTPSAAAITEARAVLAENRKGVDVIGGQMVDEAVARKARRVLAAAGEPVPAA